jgi:hypothetical protein
VQISVFHDLLSQFPGDISTEDLCQRLIFQQHADHRLAYHKLFDGQRTPHSQPLTAPATCFISHAWRCKFADTVDCAEQYELRHPNMYFWFDLFVNNQHTATSNPLSGGVRPSAATSRPSAA